MKNYFLEQLDCGDVPLGLSLEVDEYRVDM